MVFHYLRHQYAPFSFGRVGPLRVSTLPSSSAVSAHQQPGLAQPPSRHPLPDVVGQAQSTHPRCPAEG